MPTFILEVAMKSMFSGKRPFSMGCPLNHHIHSCPTYKPEVLARSRLTHVKLLLSLRRKSDSRVEWAWPFWMSRLFTVVKQWKVDGQHRLCEGLKQFIKWLGCSFCFTHLQWPKNMDKDYLWKPIYLKIELIVLKCH